MHKILALLLLTFTFLFSSQMGVVHSLDPNGDGFLSIRTKPKQAEIGKLYNGDKVQILSKKGKYYKIKKMSNGQIGYAHGNWIRKMSNTATASNSTSSKSGVVAGLDPNGDGFLSLRSKPKGREIGKLYNGDKLSILESRGKWYKVKTASAGQIGWAHGNWVRETVRNGSKVAHNEMTKEEALEIISQSGFIYLPGKFKTLPDKFKKDKDVVLAAIIKNAVIATFGYIDISLRKDKDIIFAAVKSQGGALRYADASLRKDKDIVLAAVKSDGSALEFADASLRKDKDIVLAAVKSEGRALEFADTSFKRDKDIVLTAVHDWAALAYADASLRKDKDVVLAAVKSYGEALKYADVSLTNDKDVVFAAVKSYGLALEFADASLKKDKDVVLTAIIQNKCAIKYADTLLQKDSDLLSMTMYRNCD